MPTTITRVCDGCGQTDDHPRFVYADGPDTRLFHHDCVPHYLRAAHPSPAYEATENGTRGDSLRAFMIEHAEGLTEAHADTEENNR